MPMLTAVIYKNVTLLWGTESKAFLNTFPNMPLQNIDIIVGHYYMEESARNSKLISGEEIVCGRKELALL